MQLRLIPIALGLLQLLASPTSASTDTSGSIITYPIPEGVEKSTAFEVKVRTPGGKWKDLSVYRPTHTEINTTTGGRVYPRSSMVYFDFNGTAEISARWTGDRPKEVRVRPDSYGIVPSRSGHTIKFTLDRPRDVVLQINNEVFNVLHVFTNAPPVDEPSPDDDDVIYFGPGFHQVPKKIVVPSGGIVYIAGGAVVSVEAIEFTNVTNAAVRGHGVLTFPRSGNIRVTRSQNIEINGPIGLNFLARTFEAKDVLIKNWRSFSSVQWGDGIDIFCSENVLIDSVFLRNSDDCLALYNHRDEWYGDVKNVTLQNSSLWADVAHPINIGTHGNTANPEVATGITIRNVDILDHREKQLYYQGAIAINAGDSNLVKDVLIEDVRVENFRLGQLLNFRVMRNRKYNTSPGRGIRDVVIRDLEYNGEGSTASVFSGYDEERTISNVTFYNLKINGKVIKDNMQKPGWYETQDFIPLHVNDHVWNLTFSG
ncbi:hypothetical protein ACHAQA_005723 [Verticillium albo-atrum]